MKQQINEKNIFNYYCCKCNKKTFCCKFVIVKKCCCYICEKRDARAMEDILTFYKIVDVDFFIQIEHQYFQVII